MLKNSNILITGGTGSFGKKLVDILLKRYEPKKIIIYSRDELKQYEMAKNVPKEYENILRFFIGDIRDKDRLFSAILNVDIVFHSAALKQVPAAEYNPFEAIKTNILGAQNLIEACLSTNVKKVIALSTDKAAAPINLYGATKLCSDKLFVAANHYSGGKETTFSVVRYGNVFGSRGSVVPYFLDFKNKGYFPITDPKMTRFNITLDQGVDFVLSSMKKMLGGEIFIPKLPSYNVLDIAKAINDKARIEIVGIRPGEKIHEEMITVTDSLNTIEYNDYFTMMPSFEPRWSIDELINVNKDEIGKKIEVPFSYNSGENSNFLSVSEIKRHINNVL